MPDSNIVKLYKYQSFSKFEDYYKTSYLLDKVFFADWHDLNDPLEGFFITNHYKIKDGVIDQKRKIRVLCLTDNYTSYPFWAYYGQSHRGVCFEYTIDKNLLPSECCLKKIDYATELPFVNSCCSDAGEKILSTKLKSWISENETRILSSFFESTIKVDGIHLSGIILGALAGYTNSRKFLRMQKQFLCNKLVDYQPPKFYRAKILTHSPYIELKQYNNQGLLIESHPNQVPPDTAGEF